MQKISNPAASPNTTCAIILGAHSFRKANLGSRIAFKNSATDFRSYLHSEEGLRLPPDNVLWLFDEERAASDINDRIRDWLKAKRGHVRDLFVYYVGHGGVSKDGTYFLTVKATRYGAESAGGYRIDSLAESLKSEARNVRKYVIIDACFAAEAVKGFMGTLTTLASQHLTRKEKDSERNTTESSQKKTCPTSGTALLCASSSTKPGKVLPGHKYTMFSGAFLDVVRKGTPRIAGNMSLADVGTLTRDLILETYTESAVRPELHLPDQTEGAIDTIALFPNPGKGPTSDTASRPDEEIRKWVFDPESSAHFVRSVLNLHSGDFFFDHAGVIPPERSDTPTAKSDKYCVQRFQEALISLYSRQDARKAKVVLVRGPIGVGKTTLLLRYVASDPQVAPHSGPTLFFDAQGYVKHGGDPERGLSLLFDYINRAFRSRCTLVIDGLDTGIRYDSRPWTSKPEDRVREAVNDFCSLVVGARDLQLVFSADDRLSSEEHKAANALQNSLLAHFRGRSRKSQELLLHFCPNEDTGWNSRWKRVYTLSPRHLNAIPPYAICWDALHRIQPYLREGKLRLGVSQLLASSREPEGSLGVPAKKGNTHTFNVLYEVSREVLEFHEGLRGCCFAIDRDLPETTQPDKFFHQHLEPERTWEWMDLMAFEPPDESMVNSLWNVHDHISRRPWAFGNSNAMSNVVSILVLLKQYRKRPSQFHYANLSNVLLTGAAIRRCKFFGVDFTGAAIGKNDLVVEDSQFHACTFDPELLKILKRDLRRQDIRLYRVNNRKC